MSCPDVPPVSSRVLHGPGIPSEFAPPYFLVPVRCSNARYFQDITWTLEYHMHQSSHHKKNEDTLEYRGNTQTRRTSNCIPPHVRIRRRGAVQERLYMIRTFQSRPISTRVLDMNRHVTTWYLCWCFRIIFGVSMACYCFYGLPRSTVRKYQSSTFFKNTTTTTTTTRVWYSSVVFECSWSLLFSSDDNMRES